MAVPWLQIVQLVPSIVEVSRELLKRTKQQVQTTPQDAALPQTNDELAQRVAMLEDNEQRQAELVSKMAEQMSNLTRAVTALHRQALWLGGIAVVAIVIAIVAVGMAATQ